MSAWRWSRLRLAALALAAAVVAAGAHASGADASRSDTLGKSTVRQTITGDDPKEGFSFLRFARGERHVVRTELAPARRGRSKRRRSLAYFGQITDFQLADEESPARVEFLDADPSGFASSAWRPHEAVVAHAVDLTIRQLNRFYRSPIRQGDRRRARMLNAVMTGDQADNMQRNETEWVLRLLEGGVVDPNSGSSDPADYVRCPPGTPGPDEARRYTGVQDYDDYYESPQFYDPDRPLGPWAGWPRYPGLMDRAQQPFRAQGLRVRSYVAFGNHDGLAQGNEDAIRPYEDVATGCVKPLAPQPSSQDPLASLSPGYLQGLLTSDPSKVMLVPPDERRQYVDKRQFKAIFGTGRQRDRHGFAYIDRRELKASNGAAGYYAWTPKRGLRFIVLDTLSEGGVVGESSDGNIDHPQFQWLQRELRAASRRNQLIVVFGHHAKDDLEADVPDELAVRCTVNDEHGHDVNPGCDRDPRSSQPIHRGADLEALFHRYRRVVAYVAGHAHETRAEPFRSAGGGDYWEIKSPAIADWPPQHRVIEVMDNCDGTLSLFATMLDHAAPVRAPASGTSAEGLGLLALGSIERTFAWNDPQHGGEPGKEDEPGHAHGTRKDRNVELLLRDPRTRTASIRRACARVSGRRRAGPRFTG